MSLDHSLQAAKLNIEIMSLQNAFEDVIKISDLLLGCVSRN